MKRSARLLVMLFLTAGLCPAVTGCALFSSPNAAFVKGVDGYAQTLLPEYESYIDKDPSLSPDTKKLRKETAQKFRALIEQAKKE